MTPPVIPAEAFAGHARALIEAHDAWDAPHLFQTLHWRGGKLAVGTHAMILSDVHPDDYPAHLARLASEQLEAHPLDQPVGYALQIESFGVREPRPSDPWEYHAEWRYARLARTYHKMAGATEAATAWVADVHGSLWEASKRRDRDGITEHHYPADSPLMPGGQFIDALRSIAVATGAASWGLDLPEGITR